MEESKQFISKVILPNLQFKDCKFIYNRNKFIEEYIDFSYDEYISVYLDIAGIHDYYDTNLDIINMDINIIKHINKICKNNNINVYYYIYGNNTIGIYCKIKKLPKRFHKTFNRLYIFLNRNNMSINFINI